MNPQNIKKKIESGKNFVYLKRQVEGDVSKQIKENKFPGIHQENAFKRYYPTGKINAHITGFTNLEDVGQEGIELEKNKYLTGIHGERKVIKNRRGQVIEEVGPTVESQNGKDLYLTIDNKIQYIVASALEEAYLKHKAKAASAIVLDAKTGEILSLVNYPNYDPNIRESLDGNKLRNRAIVDIFEPGSTMKPFIVAAAMDKKIVNENTLFDTKELKIGKHKINDTHIYETLTVAEIIQKSSNIGTVKIGMRLSPEEMGELFYDIGLGQKPGLGFPGESKGIVRPYKKWKPIEQATMAFGHGISVSLMQMAHAYLAFTNNGEIIPISLVKGSDKSKRTKRVFSESTARKMQIMLESVTSQEGTASTARTKSYRVAGKTGTANKIENGRYTNKYVGSFIGFAPVSDPKIIVAVMIDEPRVGSYYGGMVAGPAFSKIVENILQKRGVMSDIPPEEVAAGKEISTTMQATSRISSEIKKEESSKKLPTSNSILAQSITKESGDEKRAVTPLKTKKEEGSDPIQDLLKSKGINF